MVKDVLRKDWEEMLTSIIVTLESAIHSCELANMDEEWVALNLELKKAKLELDSSIRSNYKWVCPKQGCYPLAHKWADLQGKFVL